MPKRAVGKRRVLSLLLSIWSLCLMGMIFWTLSKGFAGRGYPPLLLFTLNASLKAGHQNPKNLPVGIWWNKCWAPDCYYWGRCLEEGGALAAPFRSHHLHHLHHCYHHFGRPSFSIESLGFRVTLSGFVYDTVLVQREGGGAWLPSPSELIRILHSECHAQNGVQTEKVPGLWFQSYPWKWLWNEYGHPGHFSTKGTAWERERERKAIAECQNHVY